MRKDREDRFALYCPHCIDTRGVWKCRLTGEESKKRRGLPCTNQPEKFDECARQNIAIVDPCGAVVTGQTSLKAGSITCSYYSDHVPDNPCAVRLMKELLRGMGPNSTYRIDGRCEEGNTVKYL